MVYTITLESKSYGFEGGSDTVSVDTQADCTWKAISNKSWIRIISNPMGTGPGTFDYTVDSNPDSDLRDGTISVTGKIFQIIQTGR